METKEFLDIIEPMLKTMMKQNIEFENKFGEKAFQMGPIDISKILIFEKNHGIIIPKYYKEFLSKYNPGGIEILKLFKNSVGKRLELKMLQKL